MELMDRGITWELVSRGLLHENFSFQGEEYTYVERGMDTPADNLYGLSTVEEKETNVVCQLSLVDDIISVTIPYFGCGSLPNMLYTKIYPEKYNLIGNEEDNFRILVIPFSDMDSFSFNTQINYRMELQFHEKELCCLAFTISTMDANFHVSEVIIHLYGYIINKNNNL